MVFNVNDMIGLDCRVGARACFKYLDLRVSINPKLRLCLSTTAIKRKADGSDVTSVEAPKYTHHFPGKLPPKISEVARVVDMVNGTSQYSLVGGRT